MRKLASVQIISDIQPIKDANVIKVASVLGWRSVIKEGQYNIGDKCVFAEIDTVFPDKPEFAEFLKRGNRLKTIRLRGQVSQGVCLPMSVLPVGDYNIGDDVTNVLGITKYEAPIPAILSGEAKGAFPSFIPKTDEPRVQIIQGLLDKYLGQEFYVTEKLDGMSVTYYIKDGQFGACSRNLELKETEDSTIWKLAKYYDIESRLRNTKLNLAIQGELIGEGVQKNIYKLRGQKFYIFNIFDINNYSYLPLATVKKLLTEMNDKAPVKLELVPGFGVINLCDNILAIIMQAMGKSILNNEVEREGLVYRLLEHEIYDIEFGRVSFKAINPDYLLKYE